MSSRTVTFGGATYPLILPNIRDPRLHVAAVIITVHVLGQVGLGFLVSIPQILAAILLALAAARPFLAGDDQGRQIVVLLDASGSMRATDVKPSRLDAAKRAMRTFLDKAPDTLRVGVVSFSDEPQVVVSPTMTRG